MRPDDFKALVAALALTWTATLAEAASLVSPKVILQNSSLSKKDRIKGASRLLEKKLNHAQVKALLKAHRIGDGEVGRNGGPAGINADGTTNFTPAQLKRKAKVLQAVGFTEDEITKLFDHGLAGSLAKQREVERRILGLVEDQGSLDEAKELARSYLDKGDLEAAVQVMVIFLDESGQRFNRHTLLRMAHQAVESSQATQEFIESLYIDESLD